MSVQKNEIIFFHNESPWPFLVSTARLFLTFCAVLFFYPFFFIDTDFSLMVVSFMSLASKTKPKILYLGGSVLASHGYSQYRQYSFRPIGIGNAKWNPDNYSEETKVLIDVLKKGLLENDKKTVYDVLYIVLGNKNGFCTTSYGKVTSVINNVLVAHNHDNIDPITEKEFLKIFGFEHSDSELQFLDETNRGTIMSNISEILAPQIVMQEKENILTERALFLHDKVNLSGQKNPEYSVGLFLTKDKISSETTLIIYDSDLKITDNDSLDKKYQDIIKSNSVSVTSIDKSHFGMNIVIVACKGDQDSEIIFDRKKIDVLVYELKKLSSLYPDKFIKFDENSESFKEFIKTGKISYLNKSDFPVVKYYRPNQFYKLPHKEFKIEESKAYLSVIRGNDERFKEIKIDILPTTDDDTTN